MNLTKTAPFLFFLFGFYCLTVKGQTSSSGIIQKLQKLNTIGSVLYIAAHPDDENTRLLTYMANERKMRTAYLSITRGDGGQNLIGKEQGEPLGLIRTQELLAARRMDGAEQFFTRANDFGYSKTPEETFAIWNKDSVLADVVWVIRTFKPDVIICRFPTTGEGGHGHHTASAILAEEAFEAAADPKRFPEQLNRTEVWQVRSLFWNTFNFGGNNTTAPDQIKLDAGGFNPLLGKGYGEIAAESRSNHKSQGFGSARSRGETLEYFKQLKGTSVKSDVLESLLLSWARFPSANRLDKMITQAIKHFQPASPEASLPELVAIYKFLQGLDEKDPALAYWKRQKLKETETILLACSGLWMEAYSTPYSVIPGNETSLLLQLINRNKSTVKLNSIRYADLDTTTAIDLKTNQLYTFKHKWKLPADMPYSNPFWLNDKHSIGSYVVRDQSLIGKPENDPAAKVIFDLTILDLKLKIERGIVFKSTDPVKGEVYRPLEVLPPVLVDLSEKVYVFYDTLPQKIQVLVKANQKDLKGSVQCTVPKGWKATISSPDFNLTNKGDELKIEIVLSPENRRAALNGKISVSVKMDGNVYSKSIERLEYDHIPYQFILSDADANLVNVNLKKTGKRIGYIPGAGDDVEACLKQIGYEVTTLTDEKLSNGNLAEFDAIVTGVRAYNTNERLQVHHPKLMEFVQKGGNLIVQYNTNNRIGPVMPRIGPYPFTISRDRVTNELAEVKFLQPGHPALNHPNVIVPEDFNNWIQERGIYFATEPDTHYEKLLSMSDPNEKASEGSLIVAKYGKGNFVYTGLVFFRELPAGVPGAYRLFVNLLSLPKNP